MNENFKTKGIIIGKRDFMEADKILVVFTLDLGLIQVKAKGLKKISAKMAGHLEVFNYVELELIKGHSMYIVIGAQIIDSFEKIKEDFDRVGIFYYFCEVLNKILEEGVRHKNTFSFFLGLLEMLKAKDTNLLLLTVYFELNILSYLGFKPEFLVCVGCRDDISGHKFYFSEEKGGIICESCSSQDSYLSKISQNAIKLMRLIVEKDFGYIQNVKMEQDVPQEAKRINAFFLEHVLGRELKSKQFLVFN